LLKHLLEIGPAALAGLLYFRFMNKYLVAGLGNTGTEYAHTRHNIGFDVVNAFVTKHGGSFREDRLAYVSEIKLKGRQVTCICPTTYMNLSGKSVKYLRDKEHIAMEHILVIVDEVALPIDRVRIRPSGSAGGHNGLKSIGESLQGDNYARLRFGIGNNYPRGMQANYVLGKWHRAEEPIVQKKIAFCAEVVESFILAGIEPTMNQFNKLNITL
jgi:PTH1 family peptidyl-tRNA hydrolase